MLADVDDDDADVVRRGVLTGPGSRRARPAWVPDAGVAKRAEPPIFPPSAPMVMTYRVALGGAPAWQLISSALFMAVVIWTLIRVAGRIYSGALLQFGSRIPGRDLWHSTQCDLHASHHGGTT